MSPRAACRLETLGFEQVFDYAPGKAEWLGHGLPVEGTEADAITAGRLVHEDVVRASLGDPVGAVRDRVEGSPFPLAVVVSGDGVVLGRLGTEALDSAPELPVEEVMQSGPPTMRPHVDLQEALGRLRRNELEHGLVTTADGKLMGLISRAEVARQLE